MSDSSSSSARKAARRKAVRRRRRLLLLLVLVLIAGIVLLAVKGCEAIGNPSSPSSLTAQTTNTPNSAASATASSDKAATTASSSFTADGHYRQPAGADWNLLLVNDWNKIPDGYEDQVTLVQHGTGQFDSRAVDALDAMISAAKADGITDMCDVSTYRTQATQKKNYNKQVTYFRGQGHDQQTAEEKAGMVVKRPGYSEHHTGLAADMGGSGNFSLEENFENTAAFRWLTAHCAEYGFILRFPKDKESITGVIYEAWHYRYVGKEHAQKIMSQGLCLEEYLAQIGK